MSNYDNTNRGALFPNKRKTKANHPDYTGKIDINGTEHWVSGWLKTSKSGMQFVSISLGDPIDAPANAPGGFPTAGGGATSQTEGSTESAGGFDNTYDDDIPF